MDTNETKGNPAVLTTMGYTVNIVAYAVAREIKGAVEDEEITEQQANILAVRFERGVGEEIERVLKEAEAFAKQQLILPSV